MRYLFLILGLVMLSGCTPITVSPATPTTRSADSAFDPRQASGEGTTPPTTSTGNSADGGSDLERASDQDIDLPGTPVGGSVNSGFDPDVHGFSFRNYTNRGEVVNLTAEDMQRLFGDPVCTKVVDGDCTLTSTARHWMEKANRAMNGGHCEGLAVLSKLMFYDRIDPTQFGGEVAYDLVLDGNLPLQREIAYWWMTQITLPGSSIKISAEPSRVVTALQETFSQGKDVDEAWVLGIYQPDFRAGHSITPAAVVDQGEGIYHIMVYDNNFPGELRPLIVDTNQETWQYQSEERFTGGADPFYQGDADTNTLELIAISPRLEQQDCFFCRDGDQSEVRKRASADVEGDYFNIWLEGDADLLITDEEGRRLGYADGELVNEIPGAMVSWMRTDQDQIPAGLTPIYLVPVKISLNFLVDGSRLDVPGYADFSMIGRGGFVAIDDIWVHPGETQEVSVWADGRSRYQIIYWHNDIETPVVRIGYETPEADYAFLVQARELLTSEDELDVTVDTESGEFIISTKYNIAPVEYGLYVERTDQEREYTFARPDFSLDPDTTVTLVYGEWEGDGAEMRALVDYGSNGQIDKEVELPDQQIEIDFYAPTWDSSGSD